MVGNTYIYLACPQIIKCSYLISKNIYIYGVRIYRDRIAKGSNESIKAGALDTLMLIYDKRIEYFGQEGLTLGRKGLDLFKYDRSIEYGFKKRVNLLRISYRRETAKVAIFEYDEVLYIR